MPTALYQRFSVLVADSVHPNVIAGSVVLLLPVTCRIAVLAGGELKTYERRSRLLSQPVWWVFTFLVARACCLAARA